MDRVKSMFPADFQRGLTDWELAGLESPSGYHGDLEAVSRIEWSWVGNDCRVVVFRLLHKNYLLMTVKGGSSHTAELHSRPSFELLDYLVAHLDQESTKEISPLQS